MQGQQLHKKKGRRPLGPALAKKIGNKNLHVVQQRKLRNLGRC